MFDAYLSVDNAPLRRLREEFGVTHLIVETRDFTDPKHAPKYCAPWRSRIRRRLAEIKGHEYLLSETLRHKAAIYDGRADIARSCEIALTTTSSVITS